MAEDWWCLLIALAFSIGPDTGIFLPAWLIHESIQQVLVVFFTSLCLSANRSDVLGPVPALKCKPICASTWVLQTHKCFVISMGSWKLLLVDRRDSCRCLRCLSKDLSSTHCLLVHRYGYQRLVCPSKAPPAVAVWFHAPSWQIECAARWILSNFERRKNERMPFGAPASSML